ncbi:hypothetical protein Tco_0545654 [Tanacetum coccineum]
MIRSCPQQLGALGKSNCYFKMRKVTEQSSTRLYVDILEAQNKPLLQSLSLLHRQIHRSIIQQFWDTINMSKHRKRMWEEFTQSIHSFVEDKKNLALHTQRKKKANHSVIPVANIMKLSRIFSVDWALQAPLRDRFRDLPEADMKEILHHRMWETKSYEARERTKKLMKLWRINGRVTLYQTPKLIWLKHEKRRKGDMSHQKHQLDLYLISHPSFHQPARSI